MGSFTQIEGSLIAGQIACPAQAIPAPGQYVLADALADWREAISFPLFRAGIVPEGMKVAPPLPESWTPGSELVLRGPTGQGFTLPPRTRRIGLVALDVTAARLLGLGEVALERGNEVTLFYDGAESHIELQDLPLAVEVLPLESLSEALKGMDYLALDLPLHSLAGLRQRLGLSSEQQLPCPAQALLLSAMPCGGLGECGGCAVHTQKGWRLACKDGPVFDLNDRSIRRGCSNTPIPQAELPVTVFRWIVGGGA